MTTSPSGPQNSDSPGSQTIVPEPPAPDPEKNPTGLSELPPQFSWVMHSELASFEIVHADLKCTPCNGVTQQQVLKIGPVPFPPGSTMNPLVVLEKAKRVACCSRCGNLKMGK